MQDDALVIEASLDNLLAMWHRWASAESVGQGYPTEAAGCKLYRVSKQHDDQNGALDHDVDASIAAAVDAAVQQMLDPHRTAIHINARNIVTGVSVWRSGRLPMDPVERAVILMEARNQIMRKLQAVGLM